MSNLTDYERGFLDGVESIYSDSFNDFINRLKNKMLNDKVLNEETVEPVKKTGVWINDYTRQSSRNEVICRATCSACEKTSEMVSEWGMIFEYCPECGAKMSGCSLYNWHKMNGR